MGYVYLVQPAGYKGTRRYKVGCTKNFGKRFIPYGKDTEVIAITNCSGYKELEKVMIKALSNVFTTVTGRELFEGDITHMTYIFHREASNWYSSEFESESESSEESDSEESGEEFSAMSYDSSSEEDEQYTSKNRFKRRRINSLSDFVVYDSSSSYSSSD